MLYGDTYLEIDYGSVVRDWVQSGAPASMTVLHESLHDDACNAVYVDGWVTRYDKFHPSAEMHWIDYGLGGLTPSALSLDESGSNELASLYTALASSGNAAWISRDQPLLARSALRTRCGRPSAIWRGTRRDRSWPAPSHGTSRQTSGSLVLLLGATHPP